MPSLSTLFPNVQHSAGDWTDEAGGTTDLHLAIDETGTGGTDYIRGLLNAATTLGEWGLTDMPSDFGSMTSISIEIRHSRGSVEGGSAGAGDDTHALLAQIVDAGGSALTDEMTILSGATGYAPRTDTVAFTGVVASDKTTWDGARLRLSTSFTQNMANDGHRVWVDFARIINGVYQAGATIAVGAASESEAANAVTPTTTVTIAVGSAAETESGVAVGVLTAISIAVGTAAETEAANTVDGSTSSGGQSISVGVASETEAANGVTAVPGGRVIAVEAAQESEATYPIRRLVPYEHESIYPVGIKLGIGVAAESEAANQVDFVQGAGSQSQPVAVASEVEAANAVAVVATISIAVGVASEVETSNAITPTSVASIAVGVANETEAANQVTATAATTIAVGIASEVEAARIVSLGLSVRTANEAETALVVNASATGQPQSRDVDVASETESANQVVFPQSIVVGVAAETEQARSVGTALSVVAALESEAAQTVTAVGGGTQVAVGTAIEVEFARPVGLSLQPSVTLETETAGDIDALSSINILVGFAQELDTAIAVGALSSDDQFIVVVAALEQESAPVLTVGVPDEQKYRIETHLEVNEIETALELMMATTEV